MVFPNFRLKLWGCCSFLVSAIFSAPLHKNRAHRLVSIRSDAVLYSLFSCDCGNGCFDKLEVVSLYIRYFIILGMYFDGFAINNKYIPHISLTIASAMQITETGMSGKI